LIMKNSLPPEVESAPETAFAIAAVREASGVIRQVQQALAGESLSKGDRSPVTVADFAAQAVVARRLQATFPHASLVGEEDSQALQAETGARTLAQVVEFTRKVIPDATSGQVCGWIDRGAAAASSQNPGTEQTRPQGTSPATFWTLDPVDGTKGFLRGDQYAIALALVREGQVVLGVLGCPELLAGQQPARGSVGSLLVAQRGHGAWCGSLLDSSEGWTRLHVSTIGDPRAARLLRSVEAAHTDTDGIGQLATQLHVEAAPVPMDSQAKYAVLAAGGGEVLLRLLSPKRPDYRERIWDQAAGSIVVEEAGGRVSDLDGAPLDFSQGRTLAKNRGVLATNGALHDAFLAGLRAVGA
jgi:3'(2'), 5'-bisphosphate nucleotidase